MPYYRRLRKEEFVLHYRVGETVRLLYDNFGQLFVLTGEIEDFDPVRIWDYNNKMIVELMERDGKLWMGSDKVYHVLKPNINIDWVPTKK